MAINPIVQNDDRLPEQVRISGCLFRSLSMLAEIKSGRTMTPQQIIDQYDWLIKNSAMDGHCYVINHASVIKAAQHYLGVPQQAKYVLRRMGDDRDFDKGAANAWIGHVQTVRGNGHFLVVAKDGRVIWDPYWPSPEPIKTLSIRGYLI